MLVNTLFVFNFVKSVVQVRVKDNSPVDRTKILGTEISLRTIEFQNIPNIETKLMELEEKGIVIMLLNFK